MYGAGIPPTPLSLEKTMRGISPLFAFFCFIMSTMPASVLAADQAFFSTLPNNGLNTASVGGDTYRINNPSSEAVVVDLAVDTVPGDSPSSTSGLDPIAYAMTADGQLIAVGDDNAPCPEGGAPVCGFACPRLSVSIAPHATLELVVRDFGAASVTSGLCEAGGAYTLAVHATGSKKTVTTTLVGHDGAVPNVRLDPELSPASRAEARSQVPGQQEFMDKKSRY